MTIESATYISDLVSTNPAAGDLKNEGDDHMRLIKSTVKATFPNITGAMSKTHTVLNALPDTPSGSYTPTVYIVGGSNVSSATTAAQASQWMRVGNVVTVSGQVTIVPSGSASTFVQLGIQLPIASAFTTAGQCAGTAACTIAANSAGTVVADGVNMRANLSFFATSTTSTAWLFTFTYLVL